MVENVEDVRTQLRFMQIPDAHSLRERQRGEIDPRPRDHIAAKRPDSIPGIAERCGVKQEVTCDRPAANLKGVNFARVQRSVRPDQIGPC